MSGGMNCYPGTDILINKYNLRIINICRVGFYGVLKKDEDILFFRQ